MSNEVKLQSHLRAARGKSMKVLVLELADAVLQTPSRLPALPLLAEEHARSVDERVRDPKNHVRDEGRIGPRRAQFDRWYSAVRTEIERDGVRLLTELERYAPEEHARFDRMAERVVSMLNALRVLNLPWWPAHCEDRQSRRELTLLDWVERELGRLETAQIRRGGARPGLFDAMQALPMHSARDDWSPLPGDRL